LISIMFVSECSSSILFDSVRNPAFPWFIGFLQVRNARKNRMKTTGGGQTKANEHS
jgi:hypothetical protein